MQKKFCIAGRLNQNPLRISEGFFTDSGYPPHLVMVGTVRMVRRFSAKADLIIAIMWAQKKAAIGLVHIAALSTKGTMSYF
jgi:hypothetical protein